MRSRINSPPELGRRGPRSALQSELFLAPASGRAAAATKGSLYPALHRMEEAGWIRAQWITKETGRRARLYDLTPAGKKQLSAEESRWQAVTSAVNRVFRTV